MKLLLSFLLSLSLVAYNAGPNIPLHNVFFAYNSTELAGSPARVVESVYRKLPAGEQIRFGINGPISNVHTTMEKNRINAARANNIKNLLKSIGNEKDVILIQDMSNPYNPKPLDILSTKPWELEILLTKAPAWQEPKFTSIDAFLPLPVQTFTINPQEDNRLVGEQGTVINIPAYTLALLNGSVPSEMTVELTEVYGNGQIVQANLHTCSGGRMLNSGGTIHLDAHANGKQARVATGKELELEFPHGETVSEKMEVFNGRFDRQGNFDWIPEMKTVRVSETRETFYINDVQVSKEEYYASIQEWENRKAAWEREQEIAEQVAANDEAIDAYLLKSDQLGWINCDEFMDVENTTEVIVMVDTTLRPSVRMVFDDISSVMNGNYNPRTGTVTFSGVPVGRSVRLVGYSIMEDVPYMANTSVTISPKLKKDLSLTPTTKPQMEAELASLN
ncbi:MAG: hypothetical protein EP314_02580 [Bacteroidetes bacterium]|nr:MAG: hypothetical protein EP314_02580 [Bacteroidota bacterium]